VPFLGRRSPGSPAARTVTAATVAFFLVKGLAWLLVPAALYLAR
jgi:hypothetical protein